jgi:hypothetical protein
MEAFEVTSERDGRLVVGFELTASGKGSGVETRARFWTVTRIAAGRITTRKTFRDRTEALEAAGLSE